MSARLVGDRQPTSRAKAAAADTDGRPRMYFVNLRKRPSDDRGGETPVTTPPTAASPSCGACCWGWRCGSTSRWRRPLRC